MKVFIVLCVVMGSSLASAQSMTCVDRVCGCCQTQKHLQRLDQFFTEVYTKSYETLNKTKQALDSRRAARVSFSAVLTDTSQDCTSQEATTVPQRVIFNSVRLDSNSYSTTTGAFTIPLSGVYVIAVTISNFDNYKSCANIVVKGEVVYKLDERSVSDTQDSASAVVQVFLSPGDVVLSKYKLTQC
uniref:C1q domain-containing protein n=1 Tax=Knipowitschia caucasica TaxID=637954 RepID=A0AAV2J555_KNICA